MVEIMDDERLAARSICALREEVKEQRVHMRVMQSLCESLSDRLKAVEADQAAYARKEGESTPRLRTAMSAVCEVFDTSPEAMVSDRRDAQLMTARQCYYTVGSLVAVASQSQIGRHCGERDHTTVASGIRSFKGKMERNHHLAAKMRRVTRIMLGELNTGHEQANG